MHTSRQKGQEQSQTTEASGVLAPLKMVPRSGRVSPSLVEGVGNYLDTKKQSTDTIANLSPRNKNETSLDPLSSRNIGNSFAKQQSPKTTKPISLNRAGLLEPINEYSTALSNAVLSKRQILVQRLILKYSAQFGTSGDILSVIQRAVAKNLEGKETIKPHIFDQIEAEISAHVQGLGGKSPMGTTKIYRSTDINNNNTNVIKLQPIKLHNNSARPYLQESKTPHPTSLQKAINKMQLLGTADQSYTDPSIMSARAKSVTRQLNALQPEARKEYTKQMVESQLNDLMASKNHPGPYYRNHDFDSESSQQLLAKNNRSNSTARRQEPLIMARDPKQTQGRIHQIKEKLSSIITQAATSDASTTQGSIQQSTNSNMIFDKILKQHFLDKNVTPTSADQISNEDLWKILTHYQIEKGHQDQNQEKDKHKQKYQDYHLTLKDQLLLNAQNRSISNQAKLNEKKTYRAYHEQLKNQMLYEELLNDQERKQALQHRIMEMKEHDILRKAHKLIDQGHSAEIAQNGNQYLKQRDEEHRELKMKTKQQRVHDNQQNLRLLKRQVLLQKAQRQEIMQAINQEESFLDRLIQKKEAKKAQLFNQWDQKHRRAEVAGSQMVDENGQMQFIVRKSRLDRLQEDEIRAKMEMEMMLQAKDEAERAQQERMEKHKQEIFGSVIEKAKQKYQVSKLQNYNSRLIDFIINKDSELYGTLKLPLLQEHVEADLQGIGEKGLIKIKQANFKEGLEEMQRIKKDPTPNQVNDIELLYNKDVFEEIGLL